LVLRVRKVYVDYRTCCLSNIYAFDPDFMYLLCTTGFLSVLKPDVSSGESYINKLSKSISYFYRASLPEISEGFKTGRLLDLLFWLGGPLLSSF